MSKNPESLKPTKNKIRKVLALSGVAAVAAVPSPLIKTKIADASPSVSYKGIVEAPITDVNSNLTPKEQTLNTKVNNAVSYIITKALDLPANSSVSSPQFEESTSGIRLYSRTITLDAAPSSDLKEEYLISFLAPKTKQGKYVTSETQYLNLSEQSQDYRKTTTNFNLTFSRNPNNQAWEISDQYNLGGHNQGQPTFLTDEIAPTNPSLRQASSFDVGQMIVKANKFMADAQARKTLH